MEQLILANSLASRRAYEAVRYTNHNDSLSDQGKALWRLIEEWYQRDASATCVNTVLLKVRAKQLHPAHHDRFVALIDSLEDKATPGNFSEILLEGRRNVLREQMTIKLMSEDEEGFRDLLREYDDLWVDLDKERQDFIGTDPAALLEAVSEGERIPLAPDALNNAIRGGGLRGHHAVIFGRPEAGKSLFAINSLVAACRAQYRGGYWENEDPIIATQLRAACCATGCTEEELVLGGHRVEKALQAAGWYDRMIFRDSPAGSLMEIEKWVKDNRLDFLVVNQMRNVKTKDRDNRVLELENISKGLREIAKTQNCFILSVTQAGDSGEGKRILRMGDLDWSNTGIQAACDLLIGFGVDPELEAMNQRCLSLCKNKIGNNHDAILIRVNTETSVID